MKEIDFLLRQKEWFRLHICGYYPLSEEFLEEQMESLNWSYLSASPRILWYESLIDTFKVRWDCEQLSWNDSLPWSDNQYTITKRLSRWIIRIEIIFLFFNREFNNFIHYTFYLLS